MQEKLLQFISMISEAPPLIPPSESGHGTIVLNREKFAEGTLGHDTFPLTLEGKTRRQMLFTLPLSQITVLPPIQLGALLHPSAKPLFPPETLEGVDPAFSLNQLLQESERSENVCKIPFVRERVEVFMRQLDTGMEGKLWEAVSGIAAVPYNVIIEDLRKKCLNTVLITGTDKAPPLDPYFVTTIVKYYGLDTGTPIPLEHIVVTNRNGERIGHQTTRAMAATAVTRLREPTRYQSLRFYTALHHSSLGRKMGFSCVADINLQLPNAQQDPIAALDFRHWGEASNFLSTLGIDMEKVTVSNLMEMCAFEEPGSNGQEIKPFYDGLSTPVQMGLLEVLSRYISTSSR